VNALDRSIPTSNCSLGAVAGFFSADFAVGVVGFVVVVVVVVVVDPDDERRPD